MGQNMPTFSAVGLDFQTQGRWHVRCYVFITMVEGIYNSAAALSVLERWQATISQNLASSGVAGFKKSDFAIKADEQMKTQYAPDGVSAARHTGGLPVRTTSINFSAGDVKVTQKPTDFAIEGDGFFKVNNTDDKPLYTRDGEFHFNADNTLVTKQGLVVQGEAGPITINPELGPLTVSRDGTMSQGNNQLGRFPLYEFGTTEGFTRVEGGYFEPPAGKTPTVVEKAAMTQGAIEASNVTPMAEMVNLIAVSRAYEAAQRALTSHDDLISKAIGTLGTPTA
jgi:flagellar basal body rod protein FlgG